MASGTVLVVTGIDRTADSVVTELNRRNVPVARLDLADFTTDTRLTARFGDAEVVVEGRVRTPSRCVDLGEVRSLYFRRPTYPEHTGLEASEAQFVEDQIRYGFSGVLQTLPSCLYVNHPRKVAAAEWKPAQLRVATDLGFPVPATIVTNEPDAAIEFAKNHGPMVYKLLAWSPYEIDGVARMVWVREVVPGELDESITGTAHMFQAKVDKRADVRVTVVGDQVFCVEISSPLVDWRENYDRIDSYRVIDPPTGLPAFLGEYLRRWGLVYGCFDFGIDHDGTWWFYECNPAGEWGWLEDATDLPISTAFAYVLEKGLV